MRVSGGPSADGKDKTQEFKFDAVLGADATQEEVFDSAFLVHSWAPRLRAQLAPERLLRWQSKCTQRCALPSV